MALIKRPVFKSIRDAARVIGAMALSPYADKEGKYPIVVTNYFYRLEEFRVKGDGVDTSIVALWGEGDFFYVYQETNGKLVIVDGVHEDDHMTPKVDVNTLYLIQRCMLVGYIPVALLRGLHETKRSERFTTDFSECIDHVEDMLDELSA